MLRSIEKFRTLQNNEKVKIYSFDALIDTSPKTSSYAKAPLSPSKTNPSPPKWHANKVIKYLSLYVAKIQYSIKPEH